MNLEFHGIPVNPGSNHPGEPLLKDLESRTLYRLDWVLNTETELDNVQWVMGTDVMGDLGFHWWDKLTTLDPNGTIAYPGVLIRSNPPLYLILHDDNFVPPGCTRVDTIDKPL